MKPKSLGLLAVGLLAGPTASDAGCAYAFSNAESNPSFSLSFAAEGFIATAGVLPVTPIGAGGFEFAPARTNLFGTGIRFEFQTAVTDTCGR
jgi:uncharacterized membrane protein YbhN (UPF0104 family)